MAYYLIKYHALWTNFPEVLDNLEQFASRTSVSGSGASNGSRGGDSSTSSTPGARGDGEGADRRIAPTSFSTGAAGTDDGVRAWIELVRRIGRTEMNRAGDRDVDLRKEYAPALEMAKQVEEIVKGREGARHGAAPPTNATETGGARRPMMRPAKQATSRQQLAVRRRQEPAVRRRQEPAPWRRGSLSMCSRMGATGSIKVALRDDINRRFPFPEPQYMMVRPRLVAAAEYVLRTVVLPPKYGPRRIVGHDCYICQNPRCRRRTLRLQDHHIDEQRYGIDDRLANQIGLCPVATDAASTATGCGSYGSTTGSSGPTRTARS
jgi:hypothetical protein